MAAERGNANHTVIEKTRTPSQLSHQKKQYTQTHTAASKKVWDGMNWGGRGDGEARTTTKKCPKPHINDLHRHVWRNNHLLELDLVDTCLLRVRQRLEFNLPPPNGRQRKTVHEAVHDVAGARLLCCGLCVSPSSLPLHTRCLPSRHKLSHPLTTNPGLQALARLSRGEVFPTPRLASDTPFRTIAFIVPFIRALVHSS